jgi:hypothetical protein|tara:strand:- start:43430 stop:44494 length:1065 start_codon:yes stop_codon:yes gene_type:complete
MKISIGTNVKEGPWGGGNLFALNLMGHLIESGHKVINHLLDDDIDIILITEPRRTSESSAYTHLDVQNYLKYVNSETLVVHRINECDERKNTNFVNKYLIEANKVADQTVFVSSWLKNLFLSQGINEKNNNVILAGANKKIFNSNGFKPWDKVEKLKIVTHHWGANWNKGFTTYSKIDKLLNKPQWREKFEFSYIGNVPKNFSFENSNIVSPLSGLELADEIKKNHLYVTGSLNEPSGNHHIEAAQCGLPILYIESGGIPEYCEEYGVAFKETNLEKKLKQIIQDYDYYIEKLDNYKFDSQIMCSEFENLFIKMIENKQNYLTNRFIDIKSKFLGRNFFKVSRLIKLQRKKYLQ